MFSFVKRALVFLALLAVVFGGLEWFVESRPNASRYKHEWLLAHAAEVHTLVLGSSHTLYGIDAATLGCGAFNLAQVSQTYRYDDYLLHHYDFSHLRTLILPYSYFSLFEDFEHSTAERHLAARYRIYMDCDIHPRLSEYGFEVTHIDGLKQRIRNWRAGTEVFWDSLGTGTNFRLITRAESWDNGAEAAAANTYITPAGENDEVVRLNISHLHNILSTARERGIHVILLTTPLTSEFRRHQDAAQAALNTRVLNKTLSLFPEVEYLDFSADTTFKETHFYDSHHLNDEGARVLTGLLPRN